jgi:undecaprenyl-diphosphatase
VSGLEALALGLVQGLTEFFPVSSSGHLVMVQDLLGVRAEGGLVFEIAVHVATLVAILVYYRRRIGGLAVGVLTGDRPSVEYAGKLALGTLPAVVFGLLGKDFVERQFANPALVGGALLVTGCVVFSTRWTSRTATLGTPTWSMALLIGCAQALAILPGISRSGSTVAAALALGVAPGPAAEYSFLLGIVAIAGAAVLMLPDLSSASPEFLGAVWIGSAAALLSGLGALTLFVRMLRSGTFQWFAIWAWGAGAAFLVWIAVGP